MLASATPDIDDPLTAAPRSLVTPAVELLVLGIAVAVAIASYLVVTQTASPERLIAPPLVALLLIANLVPGVALLMLLGRRIARRRAARSPVGGRGQLHVRLVAIFSITAAVPMLLVTIAASLLFQYGVQFWYSDRVGGMLENTTALVRTSYAQMLNRWNEQTVTMAGDLSLQLSEVPIDSRQFQKYFGVQVYFRSLNEAAIYAVTPRGEIQTLALVNPYERNLSRLLSKNKLDALVSGKRSIVTVSAGRVEVVTALPGTRGLYLYAGRMDDLVDVDAQTSRATAVLADYRSLLARARTLQLQFNAALLILSLLIVGVAVWIALAVADRLVRPVGELVRAARSVAGGDLTARVPDPRSPDEVGTLSKAFNQMTERLQEQNADLVTANDQLENRRALIEAVMAGVSAGVIATGQDGTVQIANASAERLIGAPLAGRVLSEIAPDLAGMVRSGGREAIVQAGQGGERTLAVRLAHADGGAIFTFDDITQQLIDQRRAAWSDVARRVAHEIKNPLTPIQLAAERLQRRYGSKVDAEDTTFARLTETIVRQVGDLRRMVDEFSSFARMPKPVFKTESLLDLAQQALFLHEVAHPTVAFRLEHDDPAPTLVCDRRQIGQALTNIVKNAVEAIGAKGEQGGEVVMHLDETADGAVTVSVADDGTGLPAERDRIVEPYMTTRARGTGLGLAIVKKIVEEHHGTIAFSDRPGGGTVVSMTFDARTLADREVTHAGDDHGAEDQLGMLTRNRN